MGFEDRARKCCARGDFVRAAIVLVEGLKRYPERAESLELLLQIYTEDCDNPGLERDVLDALVRQPDCASLAGQVCVRLEEQGKFGMKRAIMQQMRERKLEIIWPPPPPEPEPEPIIEDIVEPVQSAGNSGDEQHVQAERGFEGDAELALQSAQEAGTSSIDVGFQHVDNDDEGVVEQTTRDTASVLSGNSDISAEIQAVGHDVDRADTRAEQRLYIHNETINARQNRSERSSGRKKKSGDSDASYVKTSRVTAIVIALVLLALIIGIGLYRWDDMRVSSQITRLDSMLTHFDPEHFETFETTIQETMRSTVGESRALVERNQFASAVRASESDGVIESMPDSEPVSHWGSGALILWAIEEGDIELALSETVKLEFTHPDSLSALWVRARLMEHLGDHKASQAHYEKTAQHYPNFVPAYLGLARLAARRFDVAGWDHALEQLNQVSSKHSYHELKLDTGFERVLLAVPEPQDEEASELRMQAANEANGHGEFYAAMRKYNLAVDALAHGEVAAARVLANDASMHEPELRILLILRGALDAIDYSFERSSEHFSRAVAADAALQNTSLELRLLTQYIAPLAFMAAGRPDIGLTFTTPTGSSAAEHIESAIHEPTPVDTLVSRLEQRRPVALNVQATEHFETHPIARMAVLARAQVLNALGASVYARQSLSELHDDTDHGSALAFQHFVAAVVSNEHQNTLRQIASMTDDSSEKHTAQAIVAHLEARFSDAIEHAKTGYEARPEDIHVLRPLVLSLIEAGKGREAVNVLEQARLAPIWRVALESLTVRVYARLGMREMINGKILEQLSDGQIAQKKYAVTHQIDQLATALWLRQNKFARDLLEGMITEPEHPEWKWTAGLYYRGVGDQDRAATLFKKSWRKDQNKPELLVELGSIHLEFERYDLAQDAFYEAIRRDRGNIQALRGISKAYLGYDRAKGRRHLARMVENLGSAPQYGPQRAELRKWLAVLYGLRDGESEALPYLEKARQEVGDRADLLIELARYHEARKEYAIARIHYANALQKNSTSPDAHYGLAQMAIHAGDYRVARDHLVRFIALTPAGKVQSEAQAQLVEIQNKSVQ